MDKEAYHRLRRVIVICLVVATVGAVLFIAVKLGFGYECQTKKFLGLDCPGCGATRMVMSVLELDFEQAFRYNPFLFITCIPTLLLIIYQMYLYVVASELSPWIYKVAIGYAVVQIMFGIVRNLEAFDWLKPTIV